MITSMPAPYREPEDKTLKWVIIFIALSLLLHAILFTILLIASRLVPAPKFETPEPPKENKITLSILPPPPAPKKIFVPTQQQVNAPHVQSPIESANDTRLKSRSTTARDATSIMPDLKGKPHAPDTHNSPQVKAQKTPQPATTPPTPRQQEQKPTPNPQPQMAKVLQPRPMPPQPPKPAPPKPNPPQPQVDPLTGLPVLAPISAPTLAPPNQTQPLAPAPSEQAIAGDVRGAIGAHDDNSPAAMATELGKYKQYLYTVVGSYWRPEIDQKASLIGVGVVTIRFTIHADGTLSDVEVLDGNQLVILRDISRTALTSPAPFKPFTPGMIKELGADNFTEEYNFEIY